MNSIVKTIRPTQRFLMKQLYSTSADRTNKMNIQPCDIPTDVEIEHEVSCKFNFIVAIHR